MGLTVAVGVGVGVATGGAVGGTVGMGGVASGEGGTWARGSAPDHAFTSGLAGQRMSG